MNKVVQSDMIISENLVIDKESICLNSKNSAKVVGPILSDNIADFLITSLDYGIDAMELEDLC